MKDGSKSRAKDLRVARLALEEPATASLADKLPVPRRHLSAHGDDVGATLNRHSLEWVVIHVHHLRLNRDCAAIVRGVNHQVSVAARFDIAFARVEAENLRCLRAG